MTSRVRARSSTVRVIGPNPPTMPGHPANIPVRLTIPGVGFMPASADQVEGRRIEARPSSPIPIAAKFAAMLAPVPPDEPPGVRLRSYGFFVAPNRDAYVSP